MRDNVKKVIGVILLLMLGLGALSAFLQSHSSNSIQAELERTRRDLRAQGFKTDLADFNSPIDAATRARGTTLTSAADAARSSAPGQAIDLLPAAADGSAEILWQESWLETGNGSLTWPELRDELDANRMDLDAACAAALAGPIQFELDTSLGLRQPAALQSLSQTLGARAMLELHDHHPGAAWTNVLALTRLATAWQVEPPEPCHLIQASLVTSGFKATWQALQSGRWTEVQLATLQQEWADADFFSHLPETAAYQRANGVVFCQRQRQQPNARGIPLSFIARQAAHSPGAAVSAIKQAWQFSRYRNHGTFEDENNLLLFYQQREIELRQAITAPTWVQMRTLPGVTNPAIYMPSSPFNPMSTLLSIRTRSLRLGNPNTTLIAMVAAAETRRRMLVTALALERFRLKHGAYPPTPAALAPEFLQAVPVDFMDGQPLRYRLADDGHFVLYSVGLDGLDTGGILAQPSPGSAGRASSWPRAAAAEEDLVWPRPASAAMAAAQRQQKVNTERARAELVEDEEAQAQWEHTRRHQAELERLLAAPPVTNLPDIALQGNHLSTLLRPPAATGTNALSLVQMLALHQVITGGEPETVTFELPIAYDVMTNLGELHLYIDPTNNDNSDQGCNVMVMECQRAANGGCELVWSTIYEAPGSHVLQAGLVLNDLTTARHNYDGPLLPVTLTNLCQFSTGSANFTPGIGASFHAVLPEPNARFEIELTTPNGIPLATLSGSTTNGELKAYWDLKDSQGHWFEGDEFNSVFHLTLTGSGRTQTLRGP